MIISLDTLRADVMRAYGATGRIPTPVTPNLDRFADEGVVFTRCYTPSPRTTQAMASLFTGLYPVNHGAFGLFHTLSQDANTLSEVLADEGYSTMAITTNYFLRGGRGFEQGFEVYDDFLHYGNMEYAEDVVRRVEFGLTTQPPEGKFFMWVHFLDPHWRYDPPSDALKVFDRDYPGPFTVYADIDSSLVTRGEVIFENSLSKRDRQHMQRRYLAEINYMDGHVRRLIELMRNRGMLDNTIVLIVADHGESMGEHDYYYAHGETLHEGTVRVPAILHWPNGIDPGEYDGLTSLVDLMPTILDLMGLDGDALDMDGVSLADAISDGSEPRKVAFLESDYQLIHPENPDFHIGEDGATPRSKWRGVVAGDHKLLRIPTEGGERYELYNLVSDPGEQVNLAEAQPALLAELKPLLDEWDEIVDSQRTEPTEMDEDARERIRGLGYLN